MRFSRHNFRNSRALADRSRAILDRTSSENSCVPFKNWLVGLDRPDKWKATRGIKFPRLSLFSECAGRLEREYVIRYKTWRPLSCPCVCWVLYDKPTTWHIQFCSLTVRILTETQDVFNFLLTCGLSISHITMFRFSHWEYSKLYTMCFGIKYYKMKLLLFYKKRKALNFRFIVKKKRMNYSVLQSNKCAGWKSEQFEQYGNRHLSTFIAFLLGPLLVSTLPHT